MFKIFFIASAFITWYIYYFVFLTYLDRKLIENLNYDSQVMKLLLQENLGTKNEDQNSIATIQHRNYNFMIKNLITYANGARILFDQCSESFDQDHSKQKEFLTRFIDQCFIEKDCYRNLGGEMYKTNKNNGRIVIQLNQPSPIQVFSVYARYNFFNTVEKKISLNKCLPNKFTFLGSEEINNRTLKPKVLAQAYLSNDLNLDDKFQILQDIPMVKLFLSCNSTACSKNIKTLYIEFENNSSNIQYLCHYGFGAYINYYQNIEDLNQLIQNDL